MSVGALIEFYFKLIICITIAEEPELLILVALQNLSCKTINNSCL
ncbi:hypothetical protein MICAE_440001 [Microcystis aeruginosa PCC 9806]|uniref:Uncharacterized protein n=1 Tax=Microcystis aeruginosa PCC 9806 TaxID=1160282 RepID=I4GYN8_MICAE|nr:hypothetical protein MICAE_440001 [Microcystis aeruginosa PCC 9806]